MIITPTPIFNSQNQLIKDNKSNNLNNDQSSNLSIFLILLIKFVDFYTNCSGI